MCPENFQDNILVYIDMFNILGVSFGVTKNYLGFKKIRQKFITYSMNLHIPFLIDGVVVSRDYFPKQGPINIQDCCPQQGRQTQQSTGVTLFVIE